MVAEGTPFESFTFKENGPLLCTSIFMELVYRNCYIFAIREIDEAVSDILEIQVEAERISQERLAKLENVIVFPVNLSHCRDKLEENGIAYLPLRIWRSLFNSALRTTTGRIAGMLQENGWIGRG